LFGGWDDGVSSVQLNRMWGSSEQAITFAAGRICDGMYHVLIASGVEHMAIHPD
jgi:acetyl-CoA acetyltransferase